MNSHDHVLSTLEELSAESFPDEATRRRVRDGLQKALRKTSKPFEVVEEHTTYYFTEVAIVKSLIFAGVFQQWAQDGSESLTCQELAELTGADVILLRRLMRAAASANLFNDTGDDTYSRSPWAIMMGEEPTISLRYDVGIQKLNTPSTNALPYFLRDNGFKNPTDAAHTAFQYTHGQDYFDFIATDPEFKACFHSSMALNNKFLGLPWTAIYPIDHLISEAKMDRPILVDVGGGKGHDVKLFLSSHTAAQPGSVIIQDRAEALKLINDPVLLREGGPVRLMAHDFFSPQPVKGARVYFMHRILHDWPDDKAGRILRHMAAAMERGYSRLLIYDILLGDRNPDARAAMTDISMMKLFSAKERSESEFRQLLGGVGLKLVRLWDDPGAVECIVEVELA